MKNSSAPLSLKQRLGGRNLYLVGMMGSGKSRTGPFLAKQLAYGFVDADSVIQRVTGKSISQIFDEGGENDFRGIETQVMNAIGERHSLVVATGGGVVVRSENWGVLHQGIVIWLDPPREQLLKRLLSDPAKRPLLQSSDPIGALDALISERKTFYGEADLHLAIDEESPEEVAKRIVDNLPSILRLPEDPGAPQTTAG